MRKKISVDGKISKRSFSRSIEEGNAELSECIVCSNCGKHHLFSQSDEGYITSLTKYDQQ